MEYADGVARMPGNLLVPEPYEGCFIPTCTALAGQAGEAKRPAE
jgi:hypothetical protein